MAAHSLDVQFLLWPIKQPRDWRGKSGLFQDHIGTSVPIRTKSRNRDHFGSSAYGPRTLTKVCSLKLTTQITWACSSPCSSSFGSRDISVFTISSLGQLVSRSACHGWRLGQSQTFSCGFTTQASSSSKWRSTLALTGQECHTLCWNRFYFMQFRGNISTVLFSTYIYGDNILLAWKVQ